MIVARLEDCQIFRASNWSRSDRAAMTGAVKITDSQQLLQRLVWVLLKYSDGSEFCFQTTLNPKLLREYDIVLEEGNLVRLDKKYFVDGQMVYRQFPHQGATISLWESEHYTDPQSAKLRAFL